MVLPKEIFLSGVVLTDFHVENQALQKKVQIHCHIVS